MADLTFYYGTMESGKTTKLLQDRYNYCKYDYRVLTVKPKLDTKGNDCIVSRVLGSIKVDILLDKEESILDGKYLDMIKDVKVLLVDEAQFFSEKQIMDFWKVAHVLNISVICYGLKSNFLGIPFTGSIGLFGYADKKYELTVNCECGEVAIFNARKINGNFITDGDVVAIDGEENVSYIPLCGDCYYKKVIAPKENTRILSLKKTCKKES